MYDPRVRELVCATGNPDLFAELKIPKSTLRGWLNGEFRAAVGTESVTRTEIELYSENAKLRQRVRVLQAVMCLLFVLIRVMRCRLERERLPDGAAKGQLLEAIGKATKTLALASVLKIIGLSSSRAATCDILCQRIQRGHATRGVRLAHTGGGLLRKGRILAGPPLGFLPWHQDGRFPRSTREPDPCSRHLCAGRRLGSRQVPSRLVPGHFATPVLTSSIVFRHVISGSLAFVFMVHT